MKPETVVEILQCLVGKRAIIHGSEYNVVAVKILEKDHPARMWGRDTAIVTDCKPPMRKDAITFNSSSEDINSIEVGGDFIYIRGIVAAATIRVIGEVGGQVDFRAVGIAE